MEVARWSLCPTVFIFVHRNANILSFGGHQRPLNYKTFEYFLNFNHFTLLGENDPPVMRKVLLGIKYGDRILPGTSFHSCTNYIYLVSNDC